MISAVEFRLYNATATTFTLLPYFAAAACDTKYNDLGVINLVYPLKDFVDAGVTVSGAKTLGLAEGSLVGVIALFSDGTQQEIDRYVIESASDELVNDGVRYRTLNGRSTLVLLEDAIVYPSNWPVTSPPGHEFVNATAGTVFRTLIDRAQARGTLTNIVETGFSGTLTSSGAAWAVTLGDQNFENGTTYLQIATDLMRRGLIDMRMEGWNLVIQNGGTFGTHVPIGNIEIRPAKNATELVKATDTTESASTILIGGEEGTAVERHSSSAQTLLGRRRERFVSQGGITDSGTLTILADAELELVGRINTEETVGISLTDLTPWKDFTTADWIWVRFEGTDAPVERRVRQIAVSVDENRNYTIGLTLNSIIEENDVKLQRKIDGYAGSGGSYGSLPSTPDASIPNAPTLISGNITSATFVDSQGNYVAAVTADWTPPTTNVGGSALTDLDGYELMWRYTGDANWSPALPATDDIFNWSPVAPGRQIEVRVRAVDNSTNRSGWSSTVTHTVAVDTTAPPKPSAPVVDPAYAAVVVKWDGLGDNSGTPVAMPQDFHRLEIWRSPNSGFNIGDPGSSLAGALLTPGSYFVAGAFDVPIFIKTRAIDRAGNISTTSAQDSATPSRIQTGDVDPDALSDGVAPASSPTPTNTPGLGFFVSRWTAIANNDLVYYEVHIGTTSGFTATLGNAATLAGTTTSSQLIVRTLPDGSPLAYETEYFTKIIAFDADGAAVSSSAAGGGIAKQATTEDISAAYAYLGQIVVDQLIGGSLNADVLLAGAFRTADAGARRTIDSTGDVWYDSTGTPTIVLPVEGTAQFKGDLEATAFTATGAAAFRGMTEMGKGSSMVLREGTTAAAAPPSAVVSWPNYVTVNDFNGCYGLHWLGTEFVAVQDSNSALDHITLRFSGVISDIHLSGTAGEKCWGGVVAIGSAYYVLHLSGSTWFVTRYDSGGLILASDDYTPINGTYGSGGSSTAKLAPASIGTDGTNVLIGEWDSANNRYRIQVRNATTLAVTSTINTSTNVGFTGPVTGIIGGNFDFGSFRYCILSKNGPHVYPFTSAGTYQVNDAFAVPQVGTMSGITWDGTRFWSTRAKHIASNANIFRHTTYKWTGLDPLTHFVTSTWRDTDPTGGVHETDMGPVGTFQMKKRAAVTLTSPAIPDTGGTDDPNAVSFYMGAVDATRPQLWRQTLPADGVNTITLGDGIVLSGTNPPVSNNFPGATTAILKTNKLGTDTVPSMWVDGAGDGRWLIEAWHIVGDGATGLGTVFQNGWANQGSATWPTMRFAKDRFGFVWLWGRLTRAAGVTQLQPFTLPTGYRPPFTWATVVRNSNGASTVTGVNINSDGTFGLMNTTADLLFGISFPTY